MKRRRCSRDWLVFGSLLALVWATASSMHGADTGVSLELFPTTIKLALGEKGRLTVIARNNSEAPVRVIKLDHVESDGLMVTVFRSDPETSIIGPGAAIRWVIECVQSGEAHDAGEMHFFLDYSAVDAASVLPANNTSHAGVTVQRIAPSSLDKILEVRTDSAMKVLEDPNSGLVFLIVHNKSRFPVSICSIDIVPSAQLETTWKSAASNIVVGPETEQAFSVEVKAKDAILPGKYLLVFTVNADWTEEGASRSGSTVAKYEFDAGILGNSAMLAAVGVPSFLLLPGFLMLVVFGMLWNNVGKRTPLPLDLKKPEFWALAILLSLSTALLYPVVLNGRNYLKGYRFTDIYIVWFGSAAVALVAWSLAVVVMFAERVWREAKVRERTFSVTDKPLEVLRKLDRNGRGFNLEQGEITRDGQNVRGFILYDGSPGGPSWIAPRIELLSPPEAEEQLDDRLARTDDPRGLLEFIEQNGITARWAESVLKGATKVTEFRPANLPAASLVETV